MENVNQRKAEIMAAYNYGLGSLQLWAWQPTIMGLAAYVYTKNVIIYTLQWLTPYDYVSLRLWAWQPTIIGLAAYDCTQSLFTPT